MILHHFVVLQIQWANMIEKLWWISITFSIQYILYQAFLFCYSFCTKKSKLMTKFMEVHIELASVWVPECFCTYLQALVFYEEGHCTNLGWHNEYRNMSDYCRGENLLLVFQVTKPFTRIYDRLFVS